jgi:hypothetical protein
MRIHPFADGDSYGTFRNCSEKVCSEIKSLDNDYVLKASQVDLEEYYLAQGRLEPLILHSDQHYIEKNEPTQIDVSRDFRRGRFPGERPIVQGTRLEIAIPFEGDPMLWKVRPSTFTLSGHPEIDIQHDRILFTVAFPDDSADPTQLNAEIDRSVRSLSNGVDYLKNDVANYNTTLQREVRETLDRKRKLAQSTVGAVTALGIPMKRRAEPATFVAPIQRRKSPIGP